MFILHVLMHELTAYILHLRTVNRHGFTSADALEEVDIGDEDGPRPTFISAKLDPEYKHELVNY